MKKKTKIFLYILVGVLANILISVLIIIGSILVLPLFFKTNEKYHFDDIEEKTNTSFKTCKIISSKDTHGGFLGDGIKETIYKCDKTFDTSGIKRNWKKLPFSENLNIKLYGGTIKNGIQYPEKEDYPIPKIKNGYYYFIDQYSREYKDIKNIYSDEKLLNRYSYNFTLTVYDIDKNILYFYELDT